jgi:hypothetical protein
MLPDSTTPETWLPCPGHEDSYAVSDHGRIQRIRAAKTRPAGGFLKARPSPRGYLVVGLMRDGRQCWHTVHRLVARAFLGPPRPGDVVNHLNSIPTDNRAANLEWCTPSENLMHASRAGRLATGERNYHYQHPPKGILNGRAKLTEADVRLIRALFAQGASIPALSQRYNVTKPAIRYIVHRLTWTHLV